MPVRSRISTPPRARGGPDVDRALRRIGRVFVACTQGMRGRSRGYNYTNGAQLVPMTVYPDDPLIATLRQYSTPRPQRASFTQRRTLQSKPAPLLGFFFSSQDWVTLRNHIIKQAWSTSHDSSQSVQRKAGAKAKQAGPNQWARARRGWLCVAQCRAVHAA